MRRLFLALSFLIVAALAQPQLVSAQNQLISYDNYDVDIVVNKDGTVDVTEKIEAVLTGNFRGVQRGITINSATRSAYCRQNNLNCGGFDNIQLLEVRGRDGNILPESAYTSGIQENEETEEDYFLVQYYVWPERRAVYSETVSWSIKYRLYGSLGFTDNQTALLYWNVLPEERNGPVNSSKINIQFPQEHLAQRRKLNLYGFNSANPQIQTQRNSLTINLNRITLPRENFTVEYLIDDGSVIRPATLVLNMQTPWLPANQFILNGVEFNNLVTIPAGRQNLKVGYAGYEYQNFDLNIEPGSILRLDINLTPTPGMQIALFANLFLTILGGFLIFYVPIRIYRKWQSKGRDLSPANTVIPLFTPPAGIKPYLAGSLRDETVDQRDITGTIIDLAYRGFIKIKETSGTGLFSTTKYTLIKDSRFKETDTLDEVESQLMSDLFAGSDSVDLDNLSKTFFVKYVKLQQAIYKKMVKDGYFLASPDKVRNNYIARGVGLFVLGVFLVIISFTLIFMLLGYPGPLTLALASLVAGLGWFIAAPHMPAKTALGSQVYNQIEGFKMYMYRAERYRLQNLTPDEFERYLGFAIAFDIEKQWSDSFKDIFKQQPEWFEGQNISVWDIYWADRFVNSFSNNLNSNVFTPASTASGSGFSGGGGFGGGFSGGGGGGGFSGGF